MHSSSRHLGDGPEGAIWRDALRRRRGSHYRPHPTPRPIRFAAFLLAMGLLVGYVPSLGGLAQAATDEPVVTREDGTNGCNGVLPTPGSENTTKRLDPDFPSDLSPGGEVGYIIDFPVDASDVSGRETFVITDCVFVDGTAIAKYSVSFVPNTEAYELRFTVPVPDSTALGAQFCNFAKTTAAPSASQASNRKAGPACFTVGGALRIEKRSGSASGPILPGATFDVRCAPATDQPPTLITGLSEPSSRDAGGVVSASGTADDGTIAIVGPSGTPCTVTETAAPAGYVLDPTPRELVIPVGTAQTTVTFVNRQTAGLTVTKSADADGTFTFDVACDSGFAERFTLVNGGTKRFTGLTVGDVCTVTEVADDRFTSVSVPADGRVEITADDAAAVAFTNTRRTGDLVVAKTTNGGTGTFTFAVDCTGATFDRTVTITGSGSTTVTGIPTGTTCTVTETADPEFTSAVTPADGTVVIAPGANTVAFTNTAKPAALAVAKTSDAAAVTAGDAVGFTVKVTNTGTGTARNATLTDPLPAAAGVAWAISPAYAGPGTCAITGAVPVQVLACSFGDLGPAATTSVHVTSATSAVTVGTLPNTARAKADNTPEAVGAATITVAAPPAVVEDIVIQRPAPAPAPAPAAPAVAPTTLPRTGSSTAGAVRAAVVLLVVGGLALVPEHLRRRRRGTVDLVTEG